MNHVNLTAAMSLLNVFLNSILVFLTYKLMVQLKGGSDLNIFGGPTGKTSKRVRCDNIAGDIESLRDSDDYLADAIAEREEQRAQEEGQIGVGGNISIATPEAVFPGLPVKANENLRKMMSDDFSRKFEESRKRVEAMTEKEKALIIGESKEEPENQRVYVGSDYPVIPITSINEGLKNVRAGSPQRAEFLLNTEGFDSVQLGENPNKPQIQEPIEKSMKEPMWDGEYESSDIIQIYHDEELMRAALKHMLDFIANPAIYDNDKWSSINNTYCTLSHGKSREKAEVLRRYFRKLDVTYKRKDGTYYSVLVSPGEAKGIIAELIEVYPWDKPIKQAQKEPEVKPVQKDGLKEAINQLCDVVEKIRQAVDRG